MRRGLAVDGGGERQHHLAHYAIAPPAATIPIREDCPARLRPAPKAGRPARGTAPGKIRPAPWPKGRPPPPPRRSWSGPAPRPNRWRRPPPYPARRRRCRAAPWPPRPPWLAPRGSGAGRVFFRSASAARRPDRGPIPGSLERSEISRSISGPAEAATLEFQPRYGAGQPRQRPMACCISACEAGVELGLGVGVAARIRSASVSASPSLKMSSPIFTATSSPDPFRDRVTRPEPATPSTVVSASFAWASCSFCCNPLRLLHQAAQIFHRLNPSNYPLILTTRRAA